MLSIGKVNNNEPIFFGGDLKHSVCTQISIILITLKFESERNSMRSHVNSMNPDITFDGHLFRTRNASIDLAIHSDAIRSVLPSDFCSQLNEQFRSPIFNFYGFDSFLTLVLSPIHSSHKILDSWEKKTTFFLFLFILNDI